MSRLRNSLVLTIVLAIGLGGSASAIQRVAAKVGVLEFRVGYAMPQGDYDGIPGMDFLFDDTELVAFDAERVYKDGFTVGLSYGQILNKHWLISVGLDYTRNKVKNPILQEIGQYQYSIDFLEDPTYHQYDLSFRSGYFLNNPVRHAWTPYFGVAALVGVSTVSAPGHETNSELDFGMSLDFGLDFKIWAEPDSRTFVTLSSINSWNFLSTKERVSHLQIGGGIKYFFGP